MAGLDTCYSGTALTVTQAQIETGRLSPALHHPAFPSTPHHQNCTCFIAHYRAECVGLSSMAGSRTLDTTVINQVALPTGIHTKDNAQIKRHLGRSRTCTSSYQISARQRWSSGSTNSPTRYHKISGDGWT